MFKTLLCCLPSINSRALRTSTRRRLLGRAEGVSKIWLSFWWLVSRLRRFLHSHPCWLEKWGEICSNHSYFCFNNLFGAANTILYFFFSSCLFCFTFHFCRFVSRCRMDTNKHYHHPLSPLFLSVYCSLCPYFVSHLWLFLDPVQLTIPRKSACAWTQHKTDCLTAATQLGGYKWNHGPHNDTEELVQLKALL